MKTYIISIITVIIIREINLELSKEKLEELLNKYTTKIELASYNFQYYVPVENINYDIDKINEIIKENGFPQNYNFFEDTGVIPKIKNQKFCGCCWAMAATTALAYRYQKRGINVDFSPQESLSCYIKDCDNGGFPIDSQLHLVKNGTITEDCLPYSSGDGITIEQCPTTCKDGSEIKRYYAKNSYTINTTITENNYYDIVTLIMGQLINDGPVITAITCYDDFSFFFMSENCSKEIYSYDGISGNPGGHAMVIVGYGFLDNKYYWLIQNSWGEGCDKGLVKIEFGQVEVESIAFSEPYIKDEVPEEPKEINIKIEALKTRCYLLVSSNSSLDDWKSPLNIEFEDLDGNNIFNFTCGVNALDNKNKTINCFPESEKLKLIHGKYKLKDAYSLGNENTFNLDKSFTKTYNIFGLNLIEPFSEYPIYVSGKGSRAIFKYQILGLDNYLPPIVSNVWSQLYLNCEIFNYYLDNSTTPSNLVYCNLNEDEVNGFETDSEDKVIFGHQCGTFISNILVRKLDKTKYPVFKVKHFVSPLNPINVPDYITSFIVADIEGSIYDFKPNNNSFRILVNIEIENQNITSEMQCFFKSPSKIGTNFIINCIFLNNNYDRAKNYYILPFYYIDNSISPFEIFINNPIKSIEFLPKEESESESEDDNNLIFLVIISILGLIVIILIIIIIIISRRFKQDHRAFSTGPLLKNEPMELME